VRKKGNGNLWITVLGDGRNETIFLFLMKIRANARSRKKTMKYEIFRGRFFRRVKFFFRTRTEGLLEQRVWLIWPSEDHAFLKAQAPSSQISKLLGCFAPFLSVLAREILAFTGNKAINE
jgi:hypothetical protein